MTSPAGDRWIIHLTAWATKCPGTGRWHQHCLDAPHSCKGQSRRRDLTAEEATIALEALGYQVEKPA
jgi:hypothetical protein